MENPVEPLKGENYEAYYDMEDLIVFLIYRGRLTSTTTAAVYNWMGASLRRLTPQAGSIRGCIFDFTAVTGYELENLATARAKSVTLRMEQMDIVRTIPTAMLVQTIEQQVLVETMMQLNRQDQNPRLKIVKSIDEAKKHFEGFHTAQAAVSKG